MAAETSFNLGNIMLESPRLLPSYASTTSDADRAGDSRGDLQDKDVRGLAIVPWVEQADHSLKRTKEQFASLDSPAGAARSITATDQMSSGMRSSMMNSSMIVQDGTDMENVNSLRSKQDSPETFSADDSDADAKVKGNKRRRKPRQKKVVYVQASADGKQKGETPPSDMWAWRKYGQKPIKGSPYPRSYYRCSSSKGCSARKQLERCRTDPSMLIITYTADHNHPWPANRNLPGGASGAAATCPDHKHELQAGNTHVQDHHEGAACEAISGNLFSSIINSANTVLEDQMVSSVDSMQVEESANWQRDVKLCLSKSNTDEEDFFADLGELPELAAIFDMETLERTNRKVEGLVCSIGRPQLTHCVRIRS